MCPRLIDQHNINLFEVHITLGIRLELRQGVDLGESQLALECSLCADKRNAFLENVQIECSVVASHDKNAP